MASNRTASMTQSGTMKLLSGLAALVGVWIVLSPFTFASTETALWNNVIAGAAILLLAGYNYYRLINEQATMVGAMALVALLGLWTIIAPFAFQIGSEALLWSNVVAGLLGLLFGAVVANSGRNVQTGIPEVTD